MNTQKTKQNQQIRKYPRMSVAPMLDWTDRHCRYLHRLLSQHALLYTEMITTGALLHGDVPRHLRFNQEEHPLALQLGGSEPADLAKAAKMGQDWGYDEINLNCGCPSERVQRGAFGACLMREADLVADGVKAMRDVVDIAVTVKHRIGIDKIESYDFVRDFVGTVADAGCNVFIVHARNAWLQGLSPKENRDIPPLRYDVVAQLKRDFPHLTIAINGGIKTDDVVQEQLEQVKSKIRAKVEHPFRVIKRQFGHVKVRYRGLRKNTQQLHTLFALANLWMVRGRLLENCQFKPAVGA
ncbi:MAG: tRNA dihydrouridine(20/20a) synthase DusA [Comamonas sp.]